MKELKKEPIFFRRNRVFRVYSGGKLFHNFFGDKAEDGNYPEEWVVSGVKALNKNPSSPKEGISITEDGTYFDDLIASYPAEMLGDCKGWRVLVKILDSAIRLPAQAHPDREFSRKYFHSEFGKTECWVILATRENASIFFGFNKELTDEEFADAIERSETDPDCMEKLLTRLPVKPGDIYLIPSGVAHAIGAGCLLLEVQEPTDFTVQPEAWCGDYHLSDFEMYLGLEHNTARKCFDLSMWGDRAVAAGRKYPRTLRENEDVHTEILIDSGDTPLFSILRHTVRQSLILHDAPGVYIVTEGEGNLRFSGKSRSLKKGDYFFLPHFAKDVCTVEGSLQLMECLPEGVKPE